MYRDKGHWEDAHRVSHREREGFSWCVCVAVCVCRWQRVVGEWVQLTRWPTSGHRTSVREHTYTTHTVLHMETINVHVCMCVCVQEERVQ